MAEVVKRSPAKRRQAARLIRENYTYLETSDRTGIGLSTLETWMSPTRGDADFQALVHGTGTLQVGPIRLRLTPAPGQPDAPDETLCWIDTDAREVIGTLHVQDAVVCRAIFPQDPQRTRAELEAGRLPYLPDAHTFPMRADALEHLADDPTNLALLCALCSDDPVTAFRAWLSIWRFRSGEDKAIRTLGDEMWEGQAQLADLLATDPFTFILKARKLGQSTICVSYAGFAARIRDEHARVHAYSYRERASIRLLEQIKFGLDRLPDFLRLPVERETRQEIVYSASGDDERTIVSYPMSKNTSIEETSTHALLDEFAFWPDTETTFGRLEPTFTAPGATATLVTTGNGPANYATTLWQAAKDGDAIFTPIFLPATARPGRDAAWLERKKRSMSASSFRSEYACTEADALAGPAEREFAQEDIDRCTTYPRYSEHEHPGLGITWPLGKKQEHFPRSKRRDPLVELRYIVAFDIGKKDATVGVVLDVTSDVWHVAAYCRRVGLSYPAIQTLIAQVAADYYPAPVVIEANSMGQAVIDNISLPNRVIGFHTGETSKARAIEKLAVKLQNWEIQFPKNELPQLYNELVGYARPDDYIVQDSVMALAMATDQAPEAYSAKNRPGRVMGVVLA
jgi:hypothetical protein